MHNCFLVANPCMLNPCTHICVVIPKGYRCICPDSSPNSASFTGSCSSGFERPKSAPLQCPCRNSGFCYVVDDMRELKCQCLPSYEGKYCDNYIPRTRIGHNTKSSVVTVLLPLILILLVALGVAVFVVCFKKRTL